jgi:hypothetical protein
MNAVDSSHAGVASGINNAVSRAAGLLAVALMGLLVVHVFGRELDRRIERRHLAPAQVAALRAERVKLGAAEAPPGFDSSERSAYRSDVEQAFTLAFRWLVLAAATLALCGAATAAKMIPDLERNARR